MFAGPLGARLPFLPIDFSDLIRDLELTDLKLHWAKRKSEGLTRVERYTSAPIPPFCKCSRKGRLFQLFWETGSLRNVRRELRDIQKTTHIPSRSIRTWGGTFIVRYAELWFILHS